MADSRDEPATQLEHLRSELDQLDRSVVELAARRQKLVAEIRSNKRDSGQALFDRARERIVFEKAEQNARSLGLPISVAVRVMQALVDASHLLQQENQHDDAAKEPRPRKILIVGGGGRMGQLFASALAKRGHRITSHEQGDGEDKLIERVKGSDITMLSVPMQVAVEMAGVVAPHVPRNALLCDINSLKLDICRVYSEICSSQALGMHPMFGPTVSSMRRQKVVICPVNRGAMSDWMIHELGRLGLDIIEASPEHHDRMMAIVQVLVHFQTLVMGESLTRTGISLEESLRFTSPIYRLELALVGRLFAQNPELYAEIELANPYADEVRQHFLASATELAQTLAQADRQEFVSQFNHVAEFFAEFKDEAMSLSNYLIEKLVERP